MTKLKNRIKKVENQILPKKEEKLMALITPKDSETREQAIKRHMEENPDDQHAKIRVIDMSKIIIR